MKRVLFVGNSHLAALKHGLAEFSPNLNYEPAFFGLHADLMEQVGSRGSCLVPKSEKASTALRTLWGRETVDCQEYDAICLVGMGSNIRPLHPLVTAFRTAGGGDFGDRHVVSIDTYRAAVIGLFEKTLIAGAALNVRKAVDKPIYIVPQPAPDHKVVERPQRGHRSPAPSKAHWLREISHSDEAAFLSPLIRESLLKVTHADGYIPQPQETLQTAFTTKTEFMTGSKRLTNSQAHEAVDNIHANARYGRLVLEAVDAFAV